MKVFVVLTERDGETTKKPGETATKKVRTEKRYTAIAIEQVWEMIHGKPEFFGVDEDLIGIYEENPAITVL